MVEHWHSQRAALALRLSTSPCAALSLGCHSTHCTLGLYLMYSTHYNFCWVSVHLFHDLHLLISHLVLRWLPRLPVTSIILCVNMRYLGDEIHLKI